MSLRRACSWLATFAPAIAFDGNYGLSLCLTYYYGGPAPFYVLYFYWVVLDPTTRGAATYTASGIYASTIQRNPLAPAGFDFGEKLISSLGGSIFNVFRKAFEVCFCVGVHGV